MNTMCEDVLNVIFEFCDCQSSFQFALCNKQIYESTMKKGFIKYISYNTLQDNLNLFMKRFIRHHKTIKNCNMYFVNNPFLWIPVWVNKVNFYSCKISETINPRNCVKTEYLCLINTSSTDSYQIKINWVKFPLLKELKVKNYKIDLEGIHEHCKLLKIINYLPSKN